VRDGAMIVNNRHKTSRGTRELFRCAGLVTNGEGTGSGPGGQNGFRFHDLFGGTGEREFVFAGAAGDQNLDGVQAVVLHRETELFVDFAESVLLEAFAHAPASARAGHIAM